MQYSLHELNQVVRGTIQGNPNSPFQHISVDSRTLSSPDNTLFIAIPGERHNGHVFIEDLIARGVKNFLVETIPNGKVKEGVNFVQVKNSLASLQKFIAYHRSGLNVPVIAITGSNGKTIVKEWLFQALQPDKNIIRSPKSYNSQIGVPLSVWMLDKIYDLAIFEAGISKPGEMKNLQSIIQPDIGIITNLKEAHQENFVSYEQKAREKLVLFQGCNKIVYCRDHSVIEKLVVKQFKGEKLFTWSMNNTADVILNDFKQEKGSTFIDLSFKGKTYQMDIPFTDKASLENSMHIITCMFLLDYNENVIRERLRNLSPVAMRLELIQGINNCSLINDTYNSDLASLDIALDFLNQQNQHIQKTLILSDIFQTGKNEAELYDEVALSVEKKGVDRFIGIGEALVRNKNRFKDGSFYRKTSEFLENIRQHKFSDEAILLKGSRDFQFERISLLLQKKIHRTVLEINLNSLIHNLNVFRSKLDPETKVMVMVKALSYGSGSYEIANALQYQQVDYLSVAFVDEGIALRNAGITLPILVMNPEISSLELMLEHNLEPELYNFRSLNRFKQVLKKQNILTFPVHIKLNSGMNRLGFDEKDLDSLLDYLKQNDKMHIQSVFSHLAAVEDPDHDDFTVSQINRFRRMSDRFVSEFNYPILRHILNSAGIERFGASQFDMVRLGIGLYGISTLKNSGLEHVTSLKSTLSQIRTVLAGDSIGYGRGCITDKDRVIGVVPIGYADGIDRRLGLGRGVFEIKGKRVQVIGNICMDICFVDLTGVQAKEGDDVIIFGKSNPVWDLAARIDTIPYEIMAGISERVNRIYYQE